jgi:hypothetical protein
MLERFLLNNSRNILLIISCCAILNAQQLSSNREITFPDLDNHLTLVCDFHTHSVFSDGSVWPDIRVEEAEKDKIDVLAVTEHLEYQPHISDIPHPDRNRSYQLATKYSNSDLLIVSGAEITRRMPLGHANAIFLKDANKLHSADEIAGIVPKDDMRPFEAANKQKAFVFWNHPTWRQEQYGDVVITEMHKTLFSKGYLHGVEVVNEFEYSEEALQIALDYDLTIIGNSDIHGLVDWDYEISKGGHRPVTLVFAKEKSEKAIKKALFQKQTVVWNRNTLIGREEWLLPLIDASLEVVSVEYKRDAAHVSIKNKSDVRFILKNNSSFNFFVNIDLVEIPAQDTIKLTVLTKGVLESFSLEFEVQNAIFAPRKHPVIKLEVK